MNSIRGPLPRIVRFYFQHWNALPSGVGIAFFPLLRPYLVNAARLLPALLVPVVLLPILLFTV